MAGFLKKLDPLGLADLGKPKSEDMGVVFVTSGTSPVGHRVAKALLDAGYEPKSVRVGIYKGPRQFGVDASVGDTVYAEFEKLGVTAISFDITDEEGYTMAVAGVKSVFCTLPHLASKGSGEESFSNFVKACHKGGVEHFVKTSFYDSGYKLAHQDMGKMTYTLLRTSNLMSTPLIQQGTVLRSDCKYVTASYAMGVNYVSPNDVAKAAVVALTERKEHKNKEYDLTGLKPTRDKDVAELLEKFYGTKIEHVPIGYHEYEDEMKKRDIPSWLVKDMATTEKVKASGVEEDKSAYTTHVETLTGKKAESFEAYLANKATMTLPECPGTGVAEAEC